MKLSRVFYSILSSSKHFRSYFNVTLLLLLIISVYVIFMSTDNTINKPEKCVPVIQKVMPNLPLVKVYGIQVI